MRSTWTALLTLGVLVSSQTARGGGPLIFSRNGNIVKWAAGASTLTVTLDRGSLGALTNAQADALVTSVLGVWGAVPESTANPTAAAGELPVDVDETNASFYLGGPLGYTPVIYDVDGSIVDALFGAGASRQILGFASPLYWVEVNPPNLPVDLPIPEGHVVLNGVFLDGVDLGASNPELTQQEFEGVIIHEVGHLLGLDHTQINALDPTNVDQPTMFPQYRGGTDMGTLAPDDIAWIAYLYPSAQYASSFGGIAGQVLEFDGAVNRGYQGINVIARRVGGGRIDAVSCVSGCLYHAGYGPANLRGRFILPGVPAGSYTVEVEEVLDIWTGGSSVGPLDPPVDFPGVSGPEFYNYFHESAWDNPTARTPFAVMVGGEVSEIDIILNTLSTGPSRAAQWLLYR